jgi:hypothetical protein
MVRRAGAVFLGISLALSGGAGVASGATFDAPKKDAPTAAGKTTNKTGAKSPAGGVKTDTKTDAKKDSKPPAAK